MQVRAELLALTAVMSALLQKALVSRNCPRLGIRHNLYSLLWQQVRTGRQLRLTLEWRRAIQHQHQRFSARRLLFISTNYLNQPE